MTSVHRCPCATRRHFLGGTALTLLAAASGLSLLAGCSEASDGAALASAKEIGPATSCSLDGMLLADYPGPKAQIVYASEPAPAFFCDTVELFSTLLAGEQVRAVQAIYVQDMEATPWDAPVGHWIDAKTAFYVHGSRKHGSMGPTLGSFAREAAAQEFAQKEGGRVLRFAEITPEIADLSGGAMHDTRM